MINYFRSCGVRNVRLGDLYQFDPSMTDFNQHYEKKKQQHRRKSSFTYPWESRHSNFCCLLSTLTNTIIVSRKTKNEEKTQKIYKSITLQLNFSFKYKKFFNFLCVRVCEQLNQKHCKKNKK